MGDRFGVSHSSAYELLEAGRGASAASAAGLPAPPTAAVARLVGRAEDPAAAWQAVVAVHGERPTARQAAAALGAGDEPASAGAMMGEEEARRIYEAEAQHAAERGEFTVPATIDGCIERVRHLLDVAEACEALQVYWARRMAQAFLEEIPWREPRPEPLIEAGLERVGGDPLHLAVETWARLRVLAHFDAPIEDYRRALRDDPEFGDPDRDLEPEEASS
jgi:hypothetical protein